jgi:two-component system chemotaxis response regulator CheB
MPKRRVLIVDDSVTIRRSLTDALSRNSDLEVVGAASNGRIALMRLAIARPDIVALDVDMPEMNGLETLAEIQRLYPQLPVIMLNVPGEQGPTATLEALTLGANDYVTKPESGPEFEHALQSVSVELAQKIRAFCPEPRHDQVSEIPRSHSISSSKGETRVDILAIGASTGGPNALNDLICSLPANFPIPTVIVQHMPPVFTQLLAQRLATRCKLRVAEARNNQQLLPGEAWVAPGDFHMTVRREGSIVRIATNQEPPENSCRPAADVLFRSVAQVYGAGVLAVVMTGMGQDGLRGCEEIHAAGGQILVQDEESSVVWGMPGFVVRAGIADGILPLQDLAGEIVNRVRRHRVPKV